MILIAHSIQYISVLLLLTFFFESVVGLIYLCARYDELHQTPSSSHKSHVRCKKEIPSKEGNENNTDASDLLSSLARNDNITHDEAEIFLSTALYLLKYPQSMADYDSLLLLVDVRDEIDFLDTMSTLKGAFNKKDPIIQQLDKDIHRSIKKLVSGFSKVSARLIKQESSKIIAELGDLVNESGLDSQN